MQPDLFPDSAEIHAGAPEAQRMDFAAIPARGAVYLLAGATQAPESGHAAAEDPAVQPILLATVGDLRAAIKRRLADTPADVRSRRVRYGQICTRLFFRRVDSAFAANYWYARAARALFPGTARALLPWRASWWIAVERAGVTRFPRFRKTADLSDASLACVGPVRDKHAAQRMVETLEDVFDLCRYHAILVQAPRGKPCAYKEMGKCPAPCDGTVPLEAYRAQVDAALSFAAGATRDAWRSDVESEMRAAAGRLEFEKAGRLKQRLKRAGAIVEGREAEGVQMTARLEEFAFLSLQPGKGKPWIEPWLVHFGAGGRIECLPQIHLKDLPAAAEPLAARCAALAANGATSLTPEQMDEAALVAHHLFREDDGLWLRLTDVAARGVPAILEAAAALRARKAPKPLVEHASDVAEAREEPADVPAGESAGGTGDVSTGAAPEEPAGQ